MMEKYSSSPTVTGHFEQIYMFANPVSGTRAITCLGNIENYPNTFQKFIGHL